MCIFWTSYLRKEVRHGEDATKFYWKEWMLEERLGRFGLEYWSMRGNVTETYVSNRITQTIYS